VSERLTEYGRSDKPPIPAGFFLQPETENIRAVLVNPSGTLTKFNRMGFLAGFGDRDIRMVRGGCCYRGSLVPEQFTAEVHSPDTLRPGAKGCRLSQPECENTGAGRSVSVRRRSLHQAGRPNPQQSTTISAAGFHDPHYCPCVTAAKGLVRLVSLEDRRERNSARVTCCSRHVGEGGTQMAGCGERVDQWGRGECCRVVASSRGV
jgi:hypothetical protein